MPFIHRERFVHVRLTHFSFLGPRQDQLLSVEDGVISASAACCDSSGMVGARPGVLLGRDFDLASCLLELAAGLVGFRQR